MKKFLINYRLKNKSRVEDTLENKKTFEATDMNHAFEKLNIFLKGFYGSNVSLTQLNIKEAA